MKNIKRQAIIKSFIILILFGLIFTNNQYPNEVPLKKYIIPGDRNALKYDFSKKHLYLIQLNLSNDSLITIVNTSLPNLELFSS